MLAGIRHESRSGHLLSDAVWLDAHFAACRQEYEELLNFARFERGISVLDAGCGSGSFLPSIRERVGQDGGVFALDFDAANVRRASETNRDVVNGVAAASVLALPFRDDCFDAVWCANTAQYFADADCSLMLREFCRVVRPGGLIALKDVDMTGFRIQPAPPFVGLHLAEAAATGPNVTAQSVGSLRGRELRGFLASNGLSSVRQLSVLIERWGPLSGADLAFWTEWLPYLAEVARSRGVPDEDRAVWEQLQTSELAAHFVTRDDFYGCELQVVAIGRVEALP
jgi:SAM-dependent methyltransferase